MTNLVKKIKDAIAIYVYMSLVNNLTTIDWMTMCQNNLWYHPFCISFGLIPLIHCLKMNQQNDAELLNEQRVYFFGQFNTSSLWSIERCNTYINVRYLIVDRNLAFQVTNSP